MRRLEISGSLSGLFFAAYVSVESYRLGLGKWDEPGPGYFPFGAASLLGMLSFLALMKTLYKKPLEPTDIGNPERPRWRNAAFVLIAMVAYASVLNSLGFLLATFLLVTFLLQVIMPQTWLMTLIVTPSVTLAFHLVFNIMLNTQLPKGTILGF